MKKQNRRYNRLVAVLCIITLLCGVIRTPARAGNENTNAGREYTTLSFKDFGLKEVTKYTPTEASASETKVIDSSSLHGYRIEGYYNFSSGTQTNCVFIGGNPWEGLFIDNGNAESIRFYCPILPDGATVESKLSGDMLTPEIYNAGNGTAPDVTTLIGTDVKISTAFWYTDVTAKKTDLLITITVNDAYTTSITVKNVAPDWLTKKFTPYALGGSGAVLTLKQNVNNELTFTDFGYEEEETFTGTSTASASKTKTIDSSSLLGHKITGYYTFAAGTQSNCVFIGGNSWEGLFIDNGNSNSIRFYCPILPDGAKCVTNLPGDTLTPDIYNANNGDAEDVTTLIGKELKISLEFACKDVTAATTEYYIYVKVNDAYSNTITISGVSPSWLTKSLSVYANAEAEGSLKIKAFKQKDTELPQEPENIVREYTTLSFKDFGFEEVTKYTPTSTAASSETKVIDSSGLHGYRIEGYYNFSSGTQTDCVFIGRNSWDGLFIDNGNAESIRFYCPILPDGATVESNLSGDMLTPAIYNAGNGTAPDVTTLIGTDVKISTAFWYADVTAAKTDLLITITVNDAYTTSITVKNIAPNWLSKRMTPYALAGSGAVLTLKQDIYDELTFTDFGYKKEETFTPTSTAAVSKIKTIDSSSLVGNRIAGYYTFNSGTQSNCVFIGGNPWEGLFIDNGDAKSIRFYCPILPDGATVRSNLPGDMLTPDIYNANNGDAKDVTTLIGEEVKISLEFACKDASAETTEYYIHVRVNDAYSTTITVSGVSPSWLTKSLSVYANATGTGPLTIKSIEKETEEQPIQKPELTKVTLKEMGIVDALYKDSSSLEASGQYAKTLLNTTLTQRLTFSTHAVNCINYAGGESVWHGINFTTWGDGRIGITSTESRDQYILDPQTAGCAIIGEEIELTLELFADPDKPEDALLGVYINGNLYDNRYMRFIGVSEKLGGYVSIYIENEGGWIKVGTPEAAPTVNPDLKKITFNSFDLMTSTIKGCTEKGECNLTSLDRVVFSDIINFSEQPGTQMIFGGGESAWHGMIWEYAGDGILYVSDANGVFAPMKFNAADAGVPMAGEDIELTLSFEYVDVDNDGEKDDVKLGVWFNGKAYLDRWIYLKNAAPNMSGRICIWSPNEDTSLSIKTYTPPIDFEWFGFTSNWKKEFGFK